MVDAIEVWNGIIFEGNLHIGDVQEATEFQQ